MADHETLISTAYDPKYQPSNPLNDALYWISWIVWFVLFGMALAALIIAIRADDKHVPHNVIPQKIYGQFYNNQTTIIFSNTSAPFLYEGPTNGMKLDTNTSTIMIYGDGTYFVEWYLKLFADTFQSGQFYILAFTYITVNDEFMQNTYNSNYYIEVGDNPYTDIRGSALIDLKSQDKVQLVVLGYFSETFGVEFGIPSISSFALTTNIVLYRI